MARLLREAVQRGVGREEAHRVLAVFPPGAAADDAPAPVVIDQSNLIETLSDRELEVLQHLAAGLTNREIAERLYLSPNTVKVHTRNIYGKLDVHSRTQAVARARELRLLSSS